MRQSTRNTVLSLVSAQPACGKLEPSKAFFWEEKKKEQEQQSRSFNIWQTFIKTFYVSDIVLKIRHDCEQDNCIQILVEEKMGHFNLVWKEQ